MLLQANCKLAMPLSDLLIFNEERHEYTHDGKSIPGVTSILGPWSGISKVPAHVLAPAAERGKRVHTACEYDDDHALDEASVADLMGYVQAWRAFKHDCQFVSIEVERRLFHPQLGYAGTCDRIGMGWVPQGIKRKTMPILLDIKSGVSDATHGPQTAAYAQAAILDGLLPARDHARLTVYLAATGRYETNWHTSPQDWAIFQAALTYHQWRIKHKLI
jgi:hypothetical protein